MSIADRIESIRPCGKVVCGLYHGREVIDVKLRLKSVGLEKTGFGVCSVIEESEARTILSSALHKHLWTNEVVLNQDSAERAVDIFISALRGNYELYTNYMWGGVEPLSHEMMDQGVLAVTKEGVVGIMWVIDGEQPVDNVMTETFFGAGPYSRANLHYVGITRAEQCCILIRTSLHNNARGEHKCSSPSYFLGLLQLRGYINEVRKIAISITRAHGCRLKLR